MAVRPSHGLQSKFSIYHAGAVAYLDRATAETFFDEPIPLDRDL